MTKLTNEQIVKLRETLANQVLEGMDLKSLEQYAFEQLHDYFSSLTENDLLEETKNIFDNTPIDEII
jgi:uncharacterized membrane protein YgaE (UPF0421/DUF939 family)